jgi:two-component system chemotaxis response regulator CheY
LFSKDIKILIADDMAMFRRLVKHSLSELDYKNSFEAHDGVQAWSALEAAQNAQQPFGLIISDWSMPKMKGIDLLKKVRSASWGGKIPFIMLTGEAEKHNIVEAVQSGVTQYIVKPFTVAALRQKLQQAYEK